MHLNKDSYLKRPFCLRMFPLKALEAFYFFVKMKKKGEKSKRFQARLDLAISWSWIQALHHTVVESLPVWNFFVYKF